MSRAVMEQALQALESGLAYPTNHPVLQALRAALAEQAQPVLPAGWDIERDSNRKWVTVRNLSSQLGQDFYPDRDPLIFAFLAALYTTPPALVVPQPLTDEQLDAACSNEPAAVYELMYGHEISVEQFRAAMRVVARAVEAEVLKRMGVQR